MNNNPTPQALAEDIWSKLRKRIFSDMPIRLVKMPEIVLVERNEVLEYLVDKIAKISQQDIQRAIAETRATRFYAGSGIPEIGDVFDTVIERETRFAILSHTWGKDELAYNDLKNKKNKKRGCVGRRRSNQSPGYAKLEHFCHVAHTEHDVEFGWMDTVCIDKSSSAELDESIRSMFTWYRNAYICITYLACSHTVDDVERDRWFTRGWTLQELVAPRRMKFYGVGWKPITGLLDDKGLLWEGRVIPETDERCLPLMNAITRVTGITTKEIQRFHPNTHDISERMGWIASRDTTRGEDKAYSMMGIFGVSISIAYGEGTQRAFYRLFKAILEVSSSHGLFNWAGSPVDDTIHPSDMIPSSAECYLGVPTIWWHRRDLDVQVEEPATLTSAGMRMKVLTVPVQFSCVDSEWKAQCMLVEEEIIIWRGTDMMESPTNTEFAFGIWNFITGPRPVPRHSTAVLLRRWLEMGWDPKWRKMETAKVIAFEPCERFCEMTVEALASENIRIETLYL
ncbi:heterokaryon incompatibility protein-domain-containing protein [Phlebopus sp. FC_14]|nr:heterokaryon incompatibility protein-domain-containing protein [Phlebopus sp. FC_14]